jgi:NitT/TauT family transport system substrate-binding protein
MIPLCALLLLLLAALVPHTEKRQRVRIAPGVWPGSEVLLLAHSQEKLPADRFQMIELPWSSAVMRALGNGAADVAVVTLDGVLRMRESGQQLRVLMALDESTGADAVMAPPEVTKVLELKGKRVGVDVRGVGSYLLLTALESAGMSINDIHLVQLIQREMESALETGEVDAVVASEPWLPGLRSKGLHSVFDSNQLSIPIVRLLVASEKAHAQFRQELVLLLKTQIDMTPLVRSGKPFDGMEVILRRERLRFEEFTSSLDHWKPLNMEDNAAMLTGESPRLVQMAAAMEEQMIRTRLLRSKPAPSDWIDASLLQEARQ